MEINIQINGHPAVISKPNGTLIKLSLFYPTMDVAHACSIFAGLASGDSNKMVLLSIVPVMTEGVFFLEVWMALPSQQAMIDHLRAKGFEVR